MFKVLSFVSCLVVCAASYAGETSVLSPTTAPASVLKTDSVAAAASSTSVAAAPVTVAAAPVSFASCNTCNNCNCNDSCNDGCCKKRERAFSRSRTHSENTTCQNCQQVKEETDTVETSRKRLNGNVVKRSRSRTSLSVR